MNENTKKLFFNKSTLFSLKAELLKKQEEVREKKYLPQHRLENFKPSIKASDNSKQEGHKEKKSLKDNLVAKNIDDAEAYRKSKAALEKKAQLYEHLADSAGNSQLADRFLVDFKEKKQQDITKRESCDTKSNPIVESDTEVYNEDDDGDWVEYVDCLGRTRKCHKSDLDLYKKRDEELIKLLPNNEDEADAEQSATQKSEKPFLVQKTNDYLQSLREKWEQKEKELLAKDNDIHYQDLLFDEARMHGVGYYSFSTDEAERRKQMEELIKKRDETLKAQKQAEEMRKKRDELVAARVAAARARQRMRAGLPPDDPEEKKNEFTKCLLEFLNEKKNEAENKAKEEEKRLREEREKERQKQRDAYIREWDLGKDGVEDKVKKFKEMSQEEYVEQQRAKRIDEFAPPDTSKVSHKSEYTFDNQGSKLDSKQKKTWSDVRPATPPPPNIGDVSNIEQKGLYFTTKKPEKIVKYKNFIKAPEVFPIHNELSDEEDQSNKKRLEKRKHESNHAEIAPPPTYEYYGPVPKNAKSKAPFHSDIRESFAQGAKSLEAKPSSIHLSKHYDFTFE
ncbi:coiled-coil domain-containing protein 174 [Zerene cesonia]|uniref:coiled-coil domain-containing protein 174 n=1 Tax=Zerene cesonia TaxID=33412 RepID=UPI0018E50FC8|nr:coiled-coil domain-containing protein 174 [Zerene cesonia]